jgi:hypothetical protein
MEPGVKSSAGQSQIIAIAKSSFLYSPLPLRERVRVRGEKEKTFGNEYISSGLLINFIDNLSSPTARLKV